MNFAEPLGFKKVETHTGQVWRRGNSLFIRFTCDNKDHTRQIAKDLKIDRVGFK